MAKMREEVSKCDNIAEAANENSGKEYAEGGKLLENVEEAKILQDYQSAGGFMASNSNLVPHLLPERLIKRHKERIDAETRRNLELQRILADNEREIEEEGWRRARISQRASVHQLTWDWSTPSDYFEPDAMSIGLTQTYKSGPRRSREQRVKSLTRHLLNSVMGFAGPNKKDPSKAHVTQIESETNNIKYETLSTTSETKESNTGLEKEQPQRKKSVKKKSKRNG